MAIQFICPNCGAKTDVGEEFAGQTGPCATCGKEVTVPIASGNTARHRSEGTRGGGVVAIVAICVVVGLLLCGAVVLVYLFLPIG